MSDYTQTTVSGFPGVNAELGKVATSIATKLDSSGGSLTGTLDVNEQRILNLPDPVSESEPLPKRYLSNLQAGLDEAVQEAEAFATAAELSAEDAEEQAELASTNASAATEAATSAEGFAASASDDADRAELAAEQAEAAGVLQSIAKTNGDTLEWGKVNEISATGTFTMPLANAVADQVFMELYFPSSDAARVVTINRAGSDLFLRGTATDTQYILNVSTAAGSRYITSNGSNRLVI